MIKYSESELIDILPPPMKDNDDVRAISYAVKMATAKLIAFSKRTALYADIDQVPEKILDLMALEMRTQYYDQTMDIDTKRNLVRSTLSWYERAGTPSAVEELVRSIFGVGEVVEWFDFDPSEGEIVPGQFDIETNAVMTPQAAEELSKIIRKVKRASSHLRRVLTRREIPQTAYAVSGLMQTKREQSIGNAPQSDEEKSQSSKCAAAVVLRSRSGIGKGAAIIVQPVSQSGEWGDRITFSTMAQDADSYCWYYSQDNGETWKKLTTWPGYDTDTVSFTLTTNRVKYLYRCEVKWADGAVVYSNAVSVSPV